MPLPLSYALAWLHTAHCKEPQATLIFWAHCSILTQWLCCLSIARVSHITNGWEQKSMCLWAPWRRGSSVGTGGEWIISVTCSCPCLEQAICPVNSVNHILHIWVLLMLILCTSTEKVREYNPSSSHLSPKPLTGIQVEAGPRATLRKEGVLLLRTPTKKTRRLGRAGTDTCLWNGGWSLYWPKTLHYNAVSTLRAPSY